MLDANDWKSAINPDRRSLAELILAQCQDVTTTWGHIAAMAGLPEGRVVQLVADLRAAGVDVPKRQRETLGPIGRASPIPYTFRGMPGTISGHDPDAARAFILAMGGVCDA